MFTYVYIQQEYITCYEQRINEKLVGKSIVTHLFLGENNSSHLISITLKLKENISK